MGAYTGSGPEGGVTGPDGSGEPVLPVEVLTCLTEHGVTADVALSFAAGLADTSEATLAAAIEACIGADEGEEGVVVPDGSGGTTTIDPAIFESLPISAEQAQCLVDTIGAEQLEGIANGTVSPVTVLGALSTCGITLTELLAGMG
jgi:hypothetical protein